jgi:hypothetical protein
MRKGTYRYAIVHVVVFVGFAHLSCLAQYAEQKSKQASDGEVIAFSNPWQMCNNCKQPFQNQLSVDLVSVFVEFAQATYGHPDNNKWDKIKVMESLRLKIVALAIHGNEVDKTERTMLINNMLSIINQTKKDINMSRWIHMPKGSEEYEYYKALCGNYEAFAYSQLGLSTSDASEEGFKIMITHYKKARAIYNLVDMKDRSNHLDAVISVLTAEKQAANEEDTVNNISFRSHEKCVRA